MNRNYSRLSKFSHFNQNSTVFKINIFPCKTDRRTIGFIENGRVTLDKNRIREIVESYGYTMELFNQLLNVNPLKHEMAEQCHKIIDEIGENKLRMIMPMLESMAK